jgi:hypothetical protein
MRRLINLPANQPQNQQNNLQNPSSQVQGMQIHVEGEMM